MKGPCLNCGDPMCRGCDWHFGGDDGKDDIRVFYRHLAEPSAEERSTGKACDACQRAYRRADVRGRNA